MKDWKYYFWPTYSISYNFQNFTLGQYLDSCGDKKPPLDVMTINNLKFHETMGLMMARIVLMPFIAAIGAVIYIIILPILTLLYIFKLIQKPKFRWP